MYIHSVLECRLMTTVFSEMEQIVLETSDRQRASRTNLVRGDLSSAILVNPLAAYALVGPLPGHFTRWNKPGHSLLCQQQHKNRLGCCTCLKIDVPLRVTVSAFKPWNSLIDWKIKDIFLGCTVRWTLTQLHPLIPSPNTHTPTRPQLTY